MDEPLTQPVTGSGHSNQFRPEHNDSASLAANRFIVASDLISLLVRQRISRTMRDIRVDCERPMKEVFTIQGDSPDSAFIMLIMAPHLSSDAAKE